MENAQVGVFNEVDSIEFDSDKFDALDREDQIAFIVQKVSFIKKNILTEIH